MRIVVLTATFLLVAGCSCAPDKPAESPSKLTAATPRPTAGSATAPSKPTMTSAVPSAAPSGAAPIQEVIAWVEAGTPADPSGFHTAMREGVTTQLGDDIAFITPSGSTKCMTDSKSDGRLACLVKLTEPPARPADTYGEWIGGWVDFDGTRLNVGSSRADPGPFGAGVGAQLAYGNSVRFGDYQCRSDPSALFCVNYAHLSGVRLADSGVEPFGCLNKVANPDVGVKFSC